MPTIDLYAVATRGGYSTIRADIEAPAHNAGAIWTTLTASWIADQAVVPRVPR
jgi:hypothetical protein